MRSSRVVLRVDGLEARLTPVTAADLVVAQTHLAQGASFFHRVATDPGWMFNASFKSFVQTQLRTIFSDAQSAITTANVAGSLAPAPLLRAMKAEAIAIAQQAVKVGNEVGVVANPPPPIITPPTPKPTDAGMTNTMPSPTDTHFVPLGTQGLKIWDVVTGSGSPVATGDTIGVFYTGWLAANGTKFDSRRSPAGPATFALSGLIQGWQQGVPGMKPGGIRRLFVPAALGYGVNGSPPNIPGNADLVFEIKLISHHH
jgi:hypothetical protein